VADRHTIENEEERRTESEEEEGGVLPLEGKISLNSKWWPKHTQQMKKPCQACQSKVVLNQQIHGFL
jgi:hypothetical protein